MDVNIFAILQSVLNTIAQSSFFHFIKILAAFVITILLIADILLLARRAKGDWKMAFYGAKVPDLKKSKYTQKWEEIKKNAESGDASKTKIAMIEADKMLGETLEKIGYKEPDTGKKIAAVKAGQLIGLEEVKFSHEIFKKIVRNSGFEISPEEIRGAIGGYEKVFRGLELLD